MSDVTSDRMSGPLGDDPSKRSGLLGRFGAKLQDAVQQGRTEDVTRRPPETLARESALAADDVAVRQGQTVVLQRMIVPEGVVIEGTMSSTSDTQIAGRVDGDVRVESRLSLEPTGIVKGKVRAATCSIRGHVHGDIESLQDLTVGETGVIQADAIAGKDMLISGEVIGNVKCGGRLRLSATARLTGNIRARTVVLDDGAVFNGACHMTKPPSQKGDSK